MGVEVEADWPFVSGLDQIAKFPQQIQGVSILQTAEVGRHLEVLRAVIDCELGFVAFGIGIGCAEWESDATGHPGLGILKQMSSPGHVGTADHDAGELVGQGFCAMPFELGQRDIGAAQGVFNQPRHFLGGSRALRCRFHPG